MIWIDNVNFTARNMNFFKAYLNYSPDKAEKDKKALKNSPVDGNVDVENLYKDAAMNLLNEISKTNKDNVLNAVKTLYGMLRIAKFIKGGMERVTTELAPITLLLPIVTPGKITQFSPIVT